jgi:UDP-2,4-diacetamido-2,4,6-trideoxy-beta-L-altropyranose hydrolase
MRCLALAQAWQDAGGEARFATASVGGAPTRRLESEGIPVEPVVAEPGSPDDVGQTAAIARGCRASWIVVDGYWAGTLYQRSLREAGFSLLVVDDTGEAGRYEADVILNQNLHAAGATYRDRRDGTTVLLGPRFALLRREFRRWRGFSRQTPPCARRLLVTLGGSDPANATLRAVRALGRFRGECELRILVGPANSHAEDIRVEAERASLAGSVLRGVDDLPALLAWSDLAVTAAGSTCWELAFFGVPMVALAVAENQRAIAGSLAAAGAASDLGWHESVDEEKLAGAVGGLLGDVAARQRMSEAGRALVDGCGADRVVECLGAARAA